LLKSFRRSWFSHSPSLPRALFTMAVVVAPVSHALQAAGLRVKNTFIDDAELLECDTCESPQPPFVFRCATVPAPRRKLLDFHFDCDGAESTCVGSSDGEEAALSIASASPVCAATLAPAWPRTMSGDDLAEFLNQFESTPQKVEVAEVQEEQQEQPSLGGGAWPRTMSGDDLADFLGYVPPQASVTLCLQESLLASSACSSSSPIEACSGSLIDSVPESAREGEQSALASLVQQECSFLKVASVSLTQLPKRTKKNMRGAPGCVTRSLRICVHGLPSSKRHSWSEPLAQSVAAALQRKRCPAFVRRFELFASLDTTDGGELVRVDLCAPRDSDED